jgi:FkbH-like protein
MVQQQLAREDDRRAYSAEDFLRAAAPEVTLRRIDSVDHPRFARAIELVNKTNQFNTTGRRWAPSEWGGYFSKRGQMHVFDVKDAYTAYGLVGVVLVQGETIRQWVMSCRVLGYDIEIAVMAKLVDIMRAAGAKIITAKLRETDANFPCRSLFAKAGFTQAGEDWILPVGASPAIPEHVTFSKES